MASLMPLLLSTPNVATSPEMASRDAIRIGSPALMVTQPNLSLAHTSAPLLPVAPGVFFFEHPVATSKTDASRARPANNLRFFMVPPPWGRPQHRLRGEQILDRH